MTPPEPLIVGEVQISTRRHGPCMRRSIQLASCPGLAVTESIGRSHTWVVTHLATGLKVVGDDHEKRDDYLSAPWAEAVRFMRQISALPIDWTAKQPEVRRADVAVEPGVWVRFSDFEER